MLLYVFLYDLHDYKCCDTMINVLYITLDTTGINAFTKNKKHGSEGFHESRIENFPSAVRFSVWMVEIC